ncbi:MAG: HAMP domain-containing sensor histidine kinase [Candidatus Paceibacterota bacterium]|jgi:signal transduction histidine kinase
MMDFKILIDDSTIFESNLIGLSLLAVIVVSLLYIIISRIWIKINENEKLKYEFITIIAHKFRTPLTAAKWLIESMVAEEQDVRRLENFKDLKQSNEKLINLTGTLIEMTNLDNETKSSYNFETTDICAFVKSIAEQHKDLFHQKNLFFSVQCAIQQLTAKIDRPRMEFVLQTILENAHNYTPPGRNVEVSIGQRSNTAIIVIVDNGIGIDHADIDKIFTKFYRTKNAQNIDTEGFGVGLFLARSIVKKHHGKITVSSPGINRGTTFTIEIPTK